MPRDLRLEIQKMLLLNLQQLVGSSFELQLIIVIQCEIISIPRSQMWHS